MTIESKTSTGHMVRSLQFIAAVIAIQLLAASAPAFAHNLPLLFNGYYAVTNSVFVDPADPAHLQIRVGGGGGASQLGKFSISTTDQRLDFATGFQTGSINMEDSDGNKLNGVYSGPSAQQPDGRVTFGGEIVFNGGTGPYAKARGTVQVDGWARVNPETSTGIGLVTFNGWLRGVEAKPSKYIAFATKANALVDNPNFSVLGKGFATRIGKFTDVTATIDSPISGFVGIVDGKFTAIYPYESTWTTKNGDEIHVTAVETVAFETVFLPDGTPVPDLNQVSRAKIYQTVIGGTGRFEDLEGVNFATAVFTPVGTDEQGRLKISARWSGCGVLIPRR